MEITHELYNTLCSDNPISREDWEEVYEYVNYIDRYMKRHGYGLGDCHHYLLKEWYNDQLDTTTSDKEGVRLLKNSIDTFTSKLYELKLIG